jgi:uncharacterized membrane protein YjdF
MRAFVIIAILASIPMVVLPFVAAQDNGNYHFAFLFLLPILWGVLRWRKDLHLHPFHYALFALALCLHNLGALGCYTRVYFGLVFDTYVHFYFGFCGALILERAFRLGLRLPTAQVWIATLMFLLGMGAIHEIMEVASTLALGPKMGMYKISDPDVFDTQKDLLCNFAGSLTALCLAALHARVQGEGAN